MTFRNTLKTLALGLTTALVQACASTPDANHNKSGDHIKTELPAPFPITPESLRKEREADARKKAAQ